MNTQNRNQYLEVFKHITRTSPYSIHKSYFDNSCSVALYLHLHPEMELLYLEEGSFTFKIEEKFYSMKAGEAIFVPQNMLHTAIEQSEHGLFRAICFAPEFLTTNMGKRDMQTYVYALVQSGIDYTLLLQGEEWKEVLSCLKSLFMQAERLENSELLVRGYLLVIWQHLYEQHISKILGETKKSRKEVQLEEVLQFMHTHFAEDLSLGDLAEQAHMSEGQFCRTFKQVTGNTPFTYLKKYRITKSCLFLSETDKKISEICSLCGFNNISYYNREFLQVMETTPSKYREEAQRYYSHSI